MASSGVGRLALILRHLGAQNGQAEQKETPMEQQQAAESRLLDQLTRGRVLVVGDVMIDRYIWGRAARLSPEAPVPIVHVDLARQAEGFRLGGAANVAHNIRHLGGQAALFGVLGADETASQAREALAGRGIEAAGVLTDATRPSTLKTRVIAQHQQVVRFDVESTTPISTRLEQSLLEAVLGATAAGCGAVLLSDYAKGVLTEGLAQGLVKALRARQIPVLVDPKVQGIERFRGASLITPNREEACAAAGVYPSKPLAHVEAAQRLLEQLELDAVLVTLGEAGIYYHPRVGEPVQWRSQAREVFDVTGAGDTVMAVLGLGVAAGLPILDALKLANVAAGVVVGKLGTSVVGRAELERALHQQSQ